MADAAIQFCQECGRDRETFPAGREVIRVCPGCASACCPDCWNLVSGACLACVPFSLPTEAPHRIVIAPEAIAPAPIKPAAGARARRGGAAPDPENSTPTPVRRPREPLPIRAAAGGAGGAAASGSPTTTLPDPPGNGHPARSSQRALRFLVGVAASGIVVVGVSFATVAATWRHEPVVAVELPSPTATATATATASATAQPTATPRATPARRTAAPATPRPAGPRPTDHRVTTPSKTRTPPPVILPPATPKPTPASTPPTPAPTSPPTPEPAQDTPAP